MFSAVRKIGLWLAKPTLLFYALPWLLLLLSLGTVAQRYLGLYQSERLFFGSFLLWIGPIPFPGAYLTLAFIAASLLAKLVLKSSFRWHNAGTIIAHASVLLLLAGGLISALTREEGYITLGKDESASEVADYHDRALVVLRNGKQVSAIAFDDLAEGGTLANPAWPFTLTVKRACYPCVPVPLSVPEPHGYGLASRMELAKALPNPDDALNHAGAMLAVQGKTPGANGVYLVFELLAEPPVIKDGKDSYTLEMKPLTRPLPFTVTLQRFEQENHPGTSMAREYRSFVQVKDGALEWKALISMNEPLRYRGYTVYQSSFIENGIKTSSVLAVVRNSGWLFPYISVITLCAGLLLHLLLRFGGRRGARAVSIAIAVSLANLTPYEQALADDGLPTYNYHAFARIPVLHEGRMKPLDSMARALLKGISGETKLADSAASAWLAEALFSPAEAMEHPLFLVKSPQLRQSLGLAATSSQHYSFNEIFPALNAQAETIKALLERDAKTYSESERELVHLSGMVTQFANLTGSLTLFAPLSDMTPELAKALGLAPEGPNSYYSLQKVRHTLMEQLKTVVARKHNDIEHYTPQEQDMAKLAYHLDVLQQMQAHNSLLRVIPGEWENKEEWLSPWGVVEAGYGSPKSGELFRGWQGMLQAWQAHDVPGWNKASADMQQALAAAGGVAPGLITLEYHYNTLAPLTKCLSVYTLALVLAAGAIMLQRRGLVRAALLCLLLGLFLHGASLLVRMAILGRPPVSTLYESMIFVSFIAGFSGGWLSWKRGGGEGVLAGSLIALTLLLLSTIFAGDGDTLEMLTAVLNTNFWLGTHVVCITAGYGFSLITAVMAHLYLFRRSVATSAEALKAPYRLLHTLAIVSLVFTATGTMLGGIWADQSWGRFWGWDPKENGALAIVIWLVWALHGRIAGQLREVGFAAVLALTAIVVALAWVGVNLLSVGLHSYGFSNAAAWGLPIFALTEVIIIAILASLNAQRRLT